MIVMGLDPSLNGFGWCICEVSDAGVLMVSAGDVCRVPVWSTARRKREGVTKAGFFDLKLKRIATQLREAVTDWQPDLLVKEQQAGGTHQRAASHKSVGAAHALAMSVAVHSETRLACVSAKEIKALTGDKETSKDAVERAVRRLVPSAAPVLDDLARTRREHVADAIGAVLVALSKGEVEL